MSNLPYYRDMQAETGPALPGAGHFTVCDFVDGMAARVPGKIAVIDGARRITYSQLMDEYNHRTQFLVERGVQPGALVGIGMQRSLEMVLWVLAVLKAGAAYVPLDPTYPSERLRFVVQDAGLRLAVVDAPEAAWVADLPLELIGAGTAVAAGNRLPLGEYTSRAAPAHAAYVIYTSGSTGLPKGVEVSHAALAHFVQVVPTALGIRADDIWLMTASIAYAVQVRQLLTPLTVGATIAIATERDLRDPVALMETVKAHGVTLVDFVPSYWRICNRVLAELPADVRVHLLDNRLRQIVSVGEPLTCDLAHTWRHTFGHPARIVNILGQTETTGMFTAYALPADVHPSHGVAPVGKPIQGVELHLVDQAGEPVADGDTGEVYISTPSLARGYLNRPELTAQRFLPHPERPESSARLYRTGDLARRRPDGNLQYLGRVDQQVKVRGKRVDLIEVETYLRHVPEVQDAAVVATANAAAETQIAGYVAAPPAAVLEAKAILTELRRHLPEYALPHRLYRLAALPYLPNGKLDRRALAAATDPATLLFPAATCDPQPSAGNNGASHSLLPGHSHNDCLPAAGEPEKLQSVLLAAWADLLEVDRAGLEDDFFAMGGTSLKAALLASRIGLALGKRVPVDLIYQAPTVGALTRALDALPEDAAVAADGLLVLLRPGDDTPPLFIVHGFGGSIVGYADLVQSLPPGCPIYGVKAVGIIGEAEPDAAIEIMAARYLQAVQTVQPSGPYRLCGYCFGGVVAYEMARQLAAQGETPELVAIIEGFAPGWRSRHSPLLKSERVRMVAENIPFWWQDYRALGMTALRRRVARKLHLHRQAEPLDGAAEPSLAQGIVDDDLSELPEYRRRLLEIHLRASRAYAPGKYSGSVTLFCSRNRTVTQTLTGPLERDLGWGQLADRVTVHVVPGAHRNLHLMPYVPSLAAILATYLAPAQ